MKYFCILIPLWISCKQVVPTTSRYYLKIENESFSLITNRMERSFQVDTIYAANDTAAIDSCVLALHGIQEASRIVREAYKEQGREDEYKYAVINAVAVSVYNDSNIDITLTLPSIIIRKSFEKYRVEPLGTHMRTIR